MRILLLSANYFPEITGIGKYSGEMAEWLVASGHEVHVVSAPPYYPVWRVAEGYSSWRYKKEKILGVTIWRCPIWVPNNPTGYKRIMHLLSFAASSLPVVLLQAFWRPDVVITIVPPLFCAPSAWLCSKLSGAKAWLHIQDLEVDTAFELGILRSTMLRIIVCKFERFLLHRFDKVSTISHKMMLQLRNKGVAEERIMLFPNWVDADSIFPLQRLSEFRGQLGISSKCIVTLYSGNMGEKQGLEVVLEAAAKMSHLNDIKFVMCGDGVTRQRLQNKFIGLDNVLWLPLQPMSKFNELLNMASIHLLPQRLETEDLVLPSKLTGMMASGRPVIAMASKGSQIEEILSGRGVVTEPGNIDQLIKAIQLLALDEKIRNEMGHSARKYALKHLNKERIMLNFLGQLKDLK